MKHFLKSIAILSFFLFSASAVFGQIEYESGYYINNLDQKVSGLIENVEWKDNPTHFNFKKNEGAESERIEMNMAKEFAVIAEVIFVRAKVAVDHSKTIAAGLDRTRDPDFKIKTIYLKRVIDGNNDLFTYDNGNLFRLFFENNQDEIKQLVYKKYSPDNRQIMTNEQYKQQLFNTLKCDALTKSDFNDLDYTVKDVSKLFIKYNECANYEYENLISTKKEDRFNVTLRPGVNFSSMTVSNSRFERNNIEFTDQTKFRFGVELEYIFSFNKGKWSGFFEPTYQSYKDEADAIVAGVDGMAAVKYSSIEVPIGVRHYLFLSKKSKLFVNAAFVIDIASKKSKISYSGESNGTELSQDPLIISTPPVIAIGAGFNYNSKLSVEFRYHTNREILERYQFYSGDYKNISLIFGYSIL